jgi:hypothetical protein
MRGMPTINGAHVIIYSTNADADREFFQDVLSLPSVDVGGGWLIFGLPPSEVAVHPSDSGESHELYLMCDDIEAFMAELGQRNVACEPVQDQGWGLVSKVILPGGGKLPVYQPRHARPPSPTSGNAKATRKPPRRKPARVLKPAAKKPARAKAGKKKPAGKATTKKRKR